MVEETHHMPIKKILAVITAVLVASAANALSPTDGHIAGKSYVNTYFHFSYSWPAALNPAKLPAQPAGGNSAKAYVYPLFSARQGNQPFGVVVVAEKLNVAGPHSTGLKSSSDYVNRIARSLRPGPVLSNIQQYQKRNAHGMVFDELSYRMNGKPAAVIATQVGEYLIVFKCNAQSEADIAGMERSALAMRMLK
jgi:hypothetical protein